jgi:hypothetical protein
VSLRGDLSALPRELRTAGLAAVALACSLILPWYQKSFFENGKVVQDNLSAFGVFTFIEAAVLLVACAVLFLVWARSQRKAFHLPGGDGTAIMLAGGWALLLLVWRLFDKPDISGPGATIGIQWGIFGALLAAGALVASGARVRAAHRPEPPNPVAEEVDWVAPPPRSAPRPDRRPRDSTAVTEALRDRPEWEGEPSDDPSRAKTRASPPATPNDRDDPSSARTTKLPEEDPSRARTTRLPRDDEATQRLWEDEEPPR